MNRTKKNLKSLWRNRRSQIDKAISRKKNQGGVIRLPVFRMYYQAVVIKKVWYLHKKRNIVQWNRKENPEINPCIYGQSMTKEAKLSMENIKSV